MTQVELTTIGSPTTVRVFVLPTRPASLAGRGLGGQTTLAGTTGSVRLESPTTGRFVVVWLTALPSVPGGFRGEIAEAVVDGE